MWEGSRRLVSSYGVRTRKWSRLGPNSAAAAAAASSSKRQDLPQHEEMGSRDPLHMIGGWHVYIARCHPRSLFVPYRRDTEQFSKKMAEWGPPAACRTRMRANGTVLLGFADQNRSKTAHHRSKACQNPSKTCKNGSKTWQNRSKSDQNGSKTCKNRSKTDQNR